MKLCPRYGLCSLRTLAFFVILACTSPRGHAQRFPFVIPGNDVIESVTSRRSLLDAPAGKHGFVRVEDEHFFVGEDRIRFWGMNLCFSANFPAHEDADVLASHLAKLGVNAVRFHHMETSNSPNGIWGEVNPNGTRVFDPEMVDRLDYLLARLHENGIYANMNLHVGRTLLPEEGFPELENVPWWANSNKWVMYYDKSVQSKVKAYCRNLLTHANPYRNDRRRVDDPGIAVIEMLNENFFSEQGYSLASRLPKRFQASLVEAWNDWLWTKYGSTEKMIRTWLEAQPPMGDPLFSVATWHANAEGWVINKPAEELPRQFGVAASKKLDPRVHALRLAPVETTEQDYQQQLSMQGLSTEKDQPLTLTYWVRSDAPRSYRVEFSTSQGGEWRHLGLYESLHSTSSWQKVQRLIVPDESVNDDVGLRLNIGNSAVPIEFAAVSLREGAVAEPLPKSQRIESKTVAVPSAFSPLAAHSDMKQFMVDTEIAWVADLKSYLIDELGVKVPIMASQVNYHAPEVNEQWNDFVDLHNYWHHPIFPSDANWDPNRWTVGNAPMEADPGHSGWPANSLLMRAPWRVDGKPMTLSEWNYPEPGLYSAGCVPAAAVIAALQDWDAVYFFDYDSTSRDSESWHRDQVVNFFDFNGQPIKLAAFSVFANVFLRGDLPPLTNRLVAAVEAPVPGTLALAHRVGVSSSKAPSPLPPEPDIHDLRSPGDMVTWKSQPPEHGIVTINTPATQGVWGTIADSSAELSSVDLRVGELDPNYGLLVATSFDGNSIVESSRILLLAATTTENQNMGWNKDRTSVGTRWGNGPTTVVGMEATVHLKTPSSDVKVYALDGNGRRTKEVPVRTVDDATEFSLSPGFATIWYEIAK